MYPGSSSSQGAWSNPDLQDSIIPASDSIQMYSQQWSMPFPSKINPVNPSSENSGSTALSASTLDNPFGTQLVNAGDSFLAHASISSQPDTTSADNLHPYVDPIRTPVDFSGAFSYSAASDGTSGGSKSPPNTASSEAQDTERPQDSSVPPIGHLSPLHLAQNGRVVSIESENIANVDLNNPTSSRQSADQALIYGDSPLPAIPFSDIIHDIFKGPTFDTPRDLRDIDKAPGQQPLYDPEERVANPQRPDCEAGTYAMCCSLGPPRMARTTPAAQVVHRKRMCQIFGTSWEGCHWRQNVFCCVCNDYVRNPFSRPRQTEITWDFDIKKSQLTYAQQLFGYGCKSPIYSQDPYYTNHEPPPPKDFGRLRVEQILEKELPDGQRKKPKPQTGPGSGAPSDGRPKKVHKCTKEQLKYYRNGGTGIFPPVSN